MRKTKNSSGPQKRDPRGMPFATKSGLAQLCILSTRMHQYIYTPSRRLQTIDAIDRPIAFMSKSLSGAELRWSTIEKECYAIVYTLSKKFEHLIRAGYPFYSMDRATTKISSTSRTVSPTPSKVARWKLMIQLYDFLTYSTSQGPKTTWLTPFPVSFPF